MSPANGGAERVEVRAAVWPQDLDAVYQLLATYFASLRDDPAVPAWIRHKDRNSELGTLHETYREESADVLLAWAGTRVSGCVAVRTLPTREDAVELKRLFVLPEARGCGIGGALIHAAIAWAQQRGAHELLLDTLPAAMPGAVRLYRSLGFEPAVPYNENTGPEFQFFRLVLCHGRSVPF